MKKISTFFLFLLIISATTALAQTKSKQADQIGKNTMFKNSKEIYPNRVLASKKEKFDLCLGMLKGYYDALDSRIEKSFALLLVVIGWIITSDTARKSLAEETVLFWGAIITLTFAILFIAFNIFHFLERFREIQNTIEELDYANFKYFTRYRMPNNILPIYLAPVLILYFFIMLLLFHTKYNLLSLFSSSKLKGSGESGEKKYDKSRKTN